MESTNNYTETDLGNVSPNPKGAYDNETAYEYLDLVEYQGGSYLCTVDFDKTVKGISPTAGQNSETWQLVALPGTSTEEYVAKHTEVIEKAKQVETSRAAVELCKQEVESAQADVEQMRQDTQQSAQSASDANTEAQQAVQQAEASRSAAQTSEQNAAASRDLANTCKEAAETAKSAAETAAQNASESKTAAETAAQNAAQSKADIDSIKAGIEEAAKGENVSQIQKNMNDIGSLKESTVNLENLYAKENLVSLELTGQTGFASKTGDIQTSYYRKECNIEGGKKYYIFTQFDPSPYHPQLVLLNGSNEVLSTYQNKETTYIGIELNVQNDCAKMIINCNDENTPVLCLQMNKYEYNGINIKNELSNIVVMRYVQVEPCCKVNGLVDKNGKLSKNTEYVQNVFSVTENEKYKLKTYCGNTFMDYVIYDKNYNVLSSSQTSVKNFEYRNYDITIPEKAKIMMVCGSKNNTAIIECCKEIRLSVDKDETVLAIQNENEVFRKKIADEQLKNDFAFSQDLIQVATFSFDDSNADIDKIEDLFEQKGVPCCFATIPKKLDEKCSNGESVREVLKRCEENGGEVLAHWQTPLTSESTDEDYYNVYVGAWKTLTQAGFIVNGIITAGGTNYQTQNFDKCIEIARPYYAYGDMTAYISDNRRPDQYINMRKFISKNTDNDIQNYIDKFINNGEHSYYARWLNFASHGESDGTTMQILGDIIDYLKEKNIPIVTWNYVFTHYNSSLLEKRIKALESS